ncbi:DUF4169 family protein [Ancylobacter terrae]|uniref:DUF4169 family protein n=1 Tax=Ancylobacter sp. sgz301288 TaxID=3342077 RepID=UPI00385A6B99
MGDIINLRRARKQKARVDAELNATARRLQFGRTKAEREAELAAKRKHEAALDGHRRQGEDDI